LFQIERAKAGVFIAKGDNMADLSAHRNKVDAALMDMLAALNQVDMALLTEKERQAYATALQIKERLIPIRVRVDQRGLKITQWVDVATSIIHDSMNTVVSHFSHDDVSQAMNDFNEVLQVKELAGQERALGVNTINAKKFLDNSRMLLFAEISGGQRIGLAHLQERLQGEAKASIDNIISAAGVSADVRQMREKMFAAYLAGQDIELDVTLWVDKTTQRINALNDLSLLLLKTVESRQTAYMEEAQGYVWQSVIFSILLLLLIAAVNYWIVYRGIRLPLNQMVSDMQRLIVTGNFSSRIHYSAADELGDMARGLNGTLEQMSRALDQVIQVVTQLSQGDFKQRVDGNYVGDLGKLAEGVNLSADSIQSVMTEVGKVIAELNDGHFDTQVSLQGQGDYRVMLTQLQSAMSSTKHIVDDVLKVMQAMSDGDFNLRMQTNAKGDLLTLKTNINESIEAMARAINGISDVVAAQALGDFTKSLPSGSFKGQLHDLKNAINYSADKVKEAISQAVQSATVVNQAAEQVADSAHSLSGRVQEQAAALEQTSASMHEMASAVDANTANAVRVAELAHEVQAKSGAGVEVMRQTIEAMQGIRQSSNQIADIVSLIDGIAFQTNLLALNAAVEAARAGEHGRGFAVVASEVRALAQKSAESAKDIKVLIDESVVRVENGTELAEKSGQMLSGITKAIEEVATMVESIAQASQEQNQGIGQVNQAIVNIDKVTQENAALVEESTAAAEMLNHEGKQLFDNVSFFQLGDASSGQLQNRRLLT